MSRREAPEKIGKSRMDPGSDFQLRMVFSCSKTKVCGASGAQNIPINSILHRGVRKKA